MGACDDEANSQPFILYFLLHVRYFERFLNFPQFTAVQVELVTLSVTLKSLECTPNR